MIAWFGALLARREPRSFAQLLEAELRADPVSLRVSSIERALVEPARAHSKNFTQGRGQHQWV